MNKEIEVLFGTQASTSDIEEIKSQFHPSNTANVNMKEYHTYSTDEQLVGKWTDGKDLYEKVIRKEVTFVGTGEVFLDPIPNAESWFIVSTSAYTNSNYQGIEFPISAINDVGGDYDFIIMNYNFKTGRMWVRRGTNASKYLQIIVRYTKTTS